MQFISIPLLDYNGKGEITLPIDKIILEQIETNDQLLYKLILSQRDSRNISQKIFCSLKQLINTKSLNDESIKKLKVTKELVKEPPIYSKDNHDQQPSIGSPPPIKIPSSGITESSLKLPSSKFVKKRKRY